MTSKPQSSNEIAEDSQQQKNFFKKNLVIFLLSPLMNFHIGVNKTNSREKSTKTNRTRDSKRKKVIRKRTVKKRDFRKSFKNPRRKFKTSKN